MLGEPIVGVSRVRGFHKVKENQNISYYYVSSKQEYNRIQKTCNSFFVFGFLEGVTIIYCLLNMNIYVSNIVESYKGTTVGKLRNSGTLYVLPNIVQC